MNREIKSKDVNKVVAYYLKLKNDGYLLDLSEEEALEMGISKLVDSACTFLTGHFYSRYS